MAKKQLDEESEDFKAIKARWFETAKNDVSDTAELADFVASLIDDYEHDYGTIVHAHAAAAVAALHCLNKSRVGGLSGFQASIVGLRVYREWLHVAGPFRVLRWENMLYPQYSYDFGTIPRDAWAWLQETAAKKLKESDSMSDRVRGHLLRIRDGMVPFGFTVSDR